MDNGLTFLFIASLLIMSALFVYVALLYTKEKHVRKEIASLNERVKKES